MAADVHRPRKATHSPLTVAGTAADSPLKKAHRIPVTGAWALRYAQAWASATRLQIFGSQETGDAGGAERNRTADLVIANDALSQLSYGPVPVSS